MAQQNQNNHPLWDFVRSMDHLGINPEPQPAAAQASGAQGEQPRANSNPFANNAFAGFFPSGPPPPPPEGGPEHNEMGGPPGGRGRHHGRRGGHNHPGGMGGWRGYGGGMGPFSGFGEYFGGQGPYGDGMGRFSGFGDHPAGEWPFSGPPRGPGHRGRHHGRRYRSRTPSSSGSESRSRSRSRARSASPHPSHAERAGPAPEGRSDGPPGPPPPHSHGHPHPHPHPHHHPGGRRGRRGPWARGPPPPPFDINAFLGNLTNNPIAQSILQNLMPGAQTNDTRNATGAETNDSVSFTPPLDLFTSPTSYTVHVSLPGAKKEDIGIHYSPANSTLTISGVVYKPGSEEFLATLTSSERHDSGMFERNVVLKGNESDGEVDADGITAKLEDGILIVTVPRIEKEWEDIKRVEIE